MPASAIPVFCFVMAALLGAVGQFLYKAGADRAAGDLGSFLLEPRILGGVACYVAVMVLFVAAFRRGGQPGMLYPIYASTFIWAAVIGLVAQGVPIRPVHVAGMVCLIVGMFLMGR